MRQRFINQRVNLWNGTVEDAKIDTELNESTEKYDL